MKERVEVTYISFPYSFCLISVPDSISVIKAQSGSAALDHSFDGALDSADLQSFAYQIANGMVRAFNAGLVTKLANTMCCMCIIIHNDSLPY